MRVSGPKEQGLVREGLTLNTTCWLHYFLNITALIISILPKDVGTPMNRLPISTGIILLSTAVVLLSFSSCSKKATEPEVIRVTGVTLNKSSTSILVGNTE